MNRPSKDYLGSTRLFGREIVLDANAHRVRSVVEHPVKIVVTQDQSVAEERNSTRLCRAARIQFDPARVAVVTK